MPETAEQLFPFTCRPFGFNNVAQMRSFAFAGSSVTPSEHGKVTTSRAKDLAAALAGNTSVCGLIIPGGYLASAALEAICTAAKVSSLPSCQV